MSTHAEDRTPTPEQVSMIAAALNLATGDVVALRSGVLTGIHLAVQCAGQNCWVHNPSEHHMVTWPVNWRYDTRTAERLCPHGIGHPDPGDISYNARMNRDVTVHGCDGCCEQGEGADAQH